MSEEQEAVPPVYSKKKTAVKGLVAGAEVVAAILGVALASDEFRAFAASKPALLAILPLAVAASRALQNFLKNYQVKD